jgi:WD40 repeat protein
VFSPDSKRLVTLSENVGQSQLWDLQPGAATPIKRQSLEGQLNRAIFSSDNRWLLTRGPEELSLWNLGSTMRAMIPIKLVDRLSDNKNVAYHKTEFSPDGHWLVVFAPYGNRPPTLFSLRGDLVTSEELTIAGSKVYFSAGLFSPDSRWLLCRRDVSYADTAAAFKLTPGKVRAYPIDSYVEDRKSFSPDGHWLAIKGLGSDVQLWDLTSKDPFSRSVALEDFELDFSDPWSANGRWLVGKEAGGNGDEIKLFDLRESLPHAFVFSGKTNTLHFTPDERYLIGWNYDGVAFWSLNLSDLVELAKKTVGRSLTEREKNQYLLTDFGLKDLPR